MNRYERGSPNYHDKIHEEDLAYMLRNTYTNTSFFLQSLTRDSNTYTYWGDMQKNLFFISDNMRDRFGFERNCVEDLLHAWGERIYNPTSKQLYYAEFEEMLAEKRDVHDMRYQVIDRNGDIFWVHCYGNIEWSEDGTTPLFFCGKITQQDESFLIDPVSSFPGEVVLLRHLDSIARKKEHCLCIGFCLNAISKINSVQGRTYGNKLIHTIANRLTAEFTGTMSFYRLDGMRFMAVASPDLQASYDTLVEKIRSIIQKNYQQMGMPMGRSSSFAVLSFPQEGLTSIDFLESITTLIRQARSDLRHPYLDADTGGIYKLQQLSSMELLINRSVNEGMVDFRPVVQPVVSTQTGQIIGGETLMRWRYDDEDVSPGVFIPLLEKDTLIHTAGRWIFEQSVMICSKIVHDLPEFYLTVNVSLQQLHDPQFLQFIPAVLEKYSLSGRHIVLEMTESCMDSEPEKVQALFAVCRQEGIRIALDDFGTGYSSMRVLLKYPLSIIKIDRSLLLEMTESEEKLNFISSIVFACHKFGNDVCIEGVESPTQQKLARDADCDMIQGFYYYRPTEIEDLYQLVKKEAVQNNR